MSLLLGQSMRWGDRKGNEVIVEKIPIPSWLLQKNKETKLISKNVGRGMHDSRMNVNVDATAVQESELLAHD